MKRKIYFFILMLVSLAFTSHGQNAVSIIIDDGMMAIPTATTTISGYPGTYDAGLGEWQFNLPDGDHDVMVTAAGYADMTETISVSSTATFFFIHMQTAYNLTFIASDGAMALSGVDVIIDGVTITTDVNGESLFSGMAAGTYAYTSTKAGYITKNGSTTIVDADAQVNLTMVVAGLGSAVTFAVTDGTSALEGAIVTFDGVDLNTDASGLTMFNDIADGTYDYSVSMSGYLASTGSVTVSGTDVSEDVVLTAMYNVIFTVADGTDALEGATVNFDGVDMTTDASGSATFVDFVDGTYNYTVSMTGYTTGSGSITVSGSDISENVALTAMYNVVFMVTDGTSVIEGATVTFDGIDITTDASGEASIIDLMDGTYNYTVSMTGYTTASGSITVSGNDVLENVALTAMYNIVFVVNEGTSEVEGAIVTFDGTDVTTDASGEASFTDFVDGIYNYTVSMSGYTTVEGFVTVSGADLTENVLMVSVITGVEENSFESTISYYPNPVKDNITVSFGRYIEECTVFVFDIEGREWKSQKSTNSANIELDLSSLNTGIYLLKIVSAEAISTSRIVVE